MLESSVKKFPDHPLLWEKVGPAYVQLSYEDVSKYIHEFAAGLRSIGLNPEERVALLLDGDKYWFYSSYSVYYNRAINIPLSVNIADPSELKFRLLHSGSRFLIVTPEHFNKIEDLLIDLPNLEFIICTESVPDKRGIDYTISELVEKGRKAINDSSFDNIFAEIKTQPEDIANIIYTSGTTSDPKGVMLTHANYSANVQQIKEYVPIDENFKTILILPWDHCFAQAAGLLPMVASGGSIGILQTGKNRMETLRNIPLNIREIKPNFLLVVPALAEALKRNIEKAVKLKGETTDKLFRKGLRIAYQYLGFTGKNGALRKIISTPLYLMYDKLIFRKIRENLGGKLDFMVGGAALLDPEIQRFFFAIGIPLYQGYGLSEASPVVSTNYKKSWKIGSTGLPLPNVQVEIRDEKGNQVNTGEKGEICVKGANVMKGYFKNEQSTNETIKDDWLYTGDIGYTDEDDHIFVLGRQKSLLISSDGKKYSPEGIEESILSRSRFMHQIMLYNDHHPYTVALVVIDNEEVFAYAKEELFNGTEEKGQDIILSEIWKEINRFKEDPEFNELFPHRWLPNAFAIIHEPFSVENRLLTPTLKMVRRRIKEIYESLLDILYTTEGKNYNSQNNRRVIKRLFQKHQEN